MGDKIGGFGGMIGRERGREQEDGMDQIRLGIGDWGVIVACLSRETVSTTHQTHAYVNINIIVGLSQVQERHLISF